MANSREEQMRMARQLRSEFGIGIGSGSSGGGRGVGGRGGGRGASNLGQSRSQIAPRAAPSNPFQRPPAGGAQQGGRGFSRSRPFSSFRDDGDDSLETNTSSSDQHNPLIVYYNDEPAPVPKKPRVEDVHSGSSTLTPPAFSTLQAGVDVTSNISAMPLSRNVEGTIPREPALQTVQSVAMSQLPSNLQRMQAASTAVTKTAGAGLYQPTTAFSGPMSAFPHPQAQPENAFPTSSMRVASVLNNQQLHQQEQLVFGQMRVDNALAPAAVGASTGIVMQGNEPLMGSAASFSSAPVAEASYQDLGAHAKPELEEVEAAINMSKDQSIIWYYNEEPPRPMTPKAAVEDSPVKYSNFEAFGYRKGRQYGNDSFFANSFFDDSSPPANNPLPVYYLDEQPGPDSAAQDPNCTCGQSAENMGLIYSRHADPGQQLSQQGNFASTSCPVHFNQEHIYGEGYLTRGPAMT